MSDKETLERLKRDALKILDASLKAADPEQAVKSFVRVDGDTLSVGSDITIDLKTVNRLLVVGGGKGSAPMGKALEDLLGDRIDKGVICVKYDHGLPLDRIVIREGAHPVPDHAGEEAAREIVDLVSSAGEDDLAISCISGGGSALLPAPAPPVTLEQKQEITRRLLSVGADIHEMNAVRKHLSLTKGGNLMSAAYPARVVNLMLSDVVGDDPDTIASGPFVPDRSSFRDVEKILKKYDLLDDAPPEIARRIEQGVEGKISDTPKEGDEIFARAYNVIVGSNILSLKSAWKAAEDLGYGTIILSSSIEGDTTEAANFHRAIAGEIRATGNPLSPPACVLSGGETTVVIKGDGLGGRNQEFALVLADAAAALPETLFLSAGTDGTDGPTDAAGAIAHTQTRARALSMGLDPGEFLERNDSYHFFEKLGDLIKTGPTRTNVMDVRIILVGSSRLE